MKSLLFVAVALGLAFTSLAVHDARADRISVSVPPEAQLQLLASQLCVAAVGSGAYVDLSNEELATFCKSTAGLILAE